MKLDAKTISVLQNFQNINPSIYIKPGNQIRTMSPTGTVLARAVVPDLFPTEFGIYDVSRFLGINSLFKESEIFFDQKYLTISNGNSKVKYVYCDQENIVTPPNREIKLDSIDIEFVLKPDVLSSVTKAMQILGYNEIAISGDGENLTISAVNTKNKTSDVYSVKIGETARTFNVILEADKLKILPIEYTVQVSNSGLAYFKGESVEYWIATKTK